MERNETNEKETGKKMRRMIAIVGLLLITSTNVIAQKNEGLIKVSPTGVNVNVNGPTTVFLTYGGLRNRRPGEAMWCGELIPAAPDLGLRCNPATIYGSLPDRFDLSTGSGRQGLTDIMSIPTSVARRAYQDAAAGETSSFFYVRRFVNPDGGPDEYVIVTCRMAGGGASVPFALTSVKLMFGQDQNVLFLKPGEKAPPPKAEILYNGTGKLMGRWEIVLPGDEPPAERDLLTEATLPLEERGLQRRYQQFSRFSVFLPPVGKYTLVAPEFPALPTAIEGAYQILLRVEVSNDQDSGSNLAAVGAGQGFIQTGAVAGFPLPVLRYFVGGSNHGAALSMKLRLPGEGVTHRKIESLSFDWEVEPTASLYRLEVRLVGGEEILSALLRAGVRTYQAPSWFGERGAGAELEWRVLALGAKGETIGESPWRGLKITP
jgi:hypothetical protein